jgi:hypothetical protein
VINGSFAPNTPWLQGALTVVIVVVASILVAEVEAVELLDVVPNPLLLMLLNNTALLPATNVVRRGILLPAAPPTLAVCLLVALSQALLLLGNVTLLRTHVRGPGLLHLDIPTTEVYCRVPPLSFYYPASTHHNRLHFLFESFHQLIE